MKRVGLFVIGVLLVLVVASTASAADTIFTWWKLTGLNNGTGYETEWLYLDIISGREHWSVFGRAQDGGPAGSVTFSQVYGSAYFNPPDGTFRVALSKAGLPGSLAGGGTLLFSISASSLEGEVRLFAVDGRLLDTGTIKLESVAAD